MRSPGRVGLLLLLGLPPALPGAFPPCVFDGVVTYDSPRDFLFLLPCNASDPHQQWTLRADGTVLNAAAGQLLSTVSHQPARVVGVDDGSRFVWNAHFFCSAPPRRRISVGWGAG